MVVRKLMVDRPKRPGRLHQLSTKDHQLTVTPDFVFLKQRVAVFVDGCFWHACPKHATKPKNNAAFWRKKLAGNRRRDALVTRTLRRAGWRVVRVWEHQLQRGTRNSKRGTKGGQDFDTSPRPSPRSRRRGWVNAECGIRRAGQGNLQPATCNFQPVPAIVRRVQRALKEPGLNRR